MCEWEKITGTECKKESELSLSYNGNEYNLCQQHFDMVLVYADTKDDDQNDLDYHKYQLEDALGYWSVPLGGEPSDHWLLLSRKIDKLIASARATEASSEIIEELERDNDLIKPMIFEHLYRMRRWINGVLKEYKGQPAQYGMPIFLDKEYIDFSDLHRRFQVNQKVIKKFRGETDE